MPCIVVKNASKFTGKHLRWKNISIKSVFVNEVPSQVVSCEIDKKFCGIVFP